MKKITSFAVVLALLMSLAVVVFASVDEEFLYDQGNLLTEEEEIRVHDALEKVSEDYGAKLTVVTLDTLPGGDIADYADELYDEMDVGYGDDSDGVLLVICMSQREYHILCNGFAADAITEREIAAIGDAFAPYLSNGDYAEGFEEFAEQCAEYLDAYLNYGETDSLWSDNKESFDYLNALIGCLVAGVIVGLIVAFVLRGQLKSVRRQNQADQYVRYGSMYITERSDFFLYRTVHRVKKESSGSSGGHSSSRSSGGGRF